MPFQFDECICIWILLWLKAKVTINNFIFYPANTSRPSSHICVSKLTIIGSNNGLSPGRRQAIISTNAGILLIWPLGSNFNEILIKILTFSFKKMHLKMSSAKWWPFCLCLNVLSLSPVCFFWQWIRQYIPCLVYCILWLIVPVLKYIPWHLILPFVSACL